MASLQSDRIASFEDFDATPRILMRLQRAAHAVLPFGVRHSAVHAQQSRVRRLGGRAALAIGLADREVFRPQRLGRPRKVYAARP